MMTLEDIQLEFNSLLHSKKITELESAYENSWLAMRNYQISHKQPMSVDQQITYSALGYSFETAKTDLMQFIMLKNAKSDILYTD